MKKIESTEELQKSGTRRLGGIYVFSGLVPGLPLCGAVSP